jgi:pimeloyl-ACP methyl ester carboxylesterase
VQRELRVNGAPLTINYVDVGEDRGGAAVVLVHGLGDRWQHWERVIPVVSAGRRVLAIDLPGFGESPLCGQPVELAMLADTIAALARELAIDRIVFVGHSLGGPLATIFASRHRGLTERLVLVGGTVQSFQRTLARRLRPWLTRPLTALATIMELAYTAPALPKPVRRRVPGSRVLRALALWPFVRSPSRLPIEDALLLIEGIGAPGVAERPRPRAGVGWVRLRVDVPVALISGDHDLIAPLADLRAYPGRVDQALIVKGTGHLRMLEAPQAFTAALLAVIAPSPEAPGSR